VAGDFDMSDEDWEDATLLRERKRILKRLADMRIVPELGQYEAGWNDALGRIEQWVQERI
jgi:hypothetical protein